MLPIEEAALILRGEERHCAGAMSGHADPEVAKLNHRFKDRAVGQHRMRGQASADQTVALVGGLRRSVEGVQRQVVGAAREEIEAADEGLPG